MGRLVESFKRVGNWLANVYLLGYPEQLRRDEEVRRRAMEGQRRAEETKRAWIVRLADVLAQHAGPEDGEAVRVFASARIVIRMGTVHSGPQVARLIREQVARTFTEPRGSPEEYSASGREAWELWTSTGGTELTDTTMDIHLVGAVPELADFIEDEWFLWAPPTDDWLEGPTMHLLYLTFSDLYPLLREAWDHGERHMCERALPFLAEALLIGDRPSNPVNNGFLDWAEGHPETDFERAWPQVLRDNVSFRP